MPQNWRGRIGRLLLVAVGCVLALAAAGAIYQSVSVRRETARFPPPGRLVDIGGRRLHLICIGEGEPTVIFEPSGFGGALSSEIARREISSRARVCSYDRMGMGWSDPGPAVNSAGLLADDLERLLDRAALKPPYILVPASIGGLTVEMFARRHPDRVAGMVFLDAANSIALERAAPLVTRTITMEACMATVAARLGVLRLIDPFALRREPTDAAARTVSRLYRVEPMATLCGIVRGVQTTLAEFRAAPPLSADVPLTVLIAETNERLGPPGFAAKAGDLLRERPDLMKAFSRRSTRGTWRIVPGSDHLIASGQPHVVATAVLELISLRYATNPAAR
jgi:pimeloyl-ACP methyl ester carboxylesterase